MHRAAGPIQGNTQHSNTHEDAEAEAVELASNRLQQMLEAEADDTELGNTVMDEVGASALAAARAGRKKAQADRDALAHRIAALKAQEKRAVAHVEMTVLKTESLCEARRAKEMIKARKPTA